MPAFPRVNELDRPEPLRKPELTVAGDSGEEGEDGEEALVGEEPVVVDGVEGNEGSETRLLLPCPTFAAPELELLDLIGIGPCLLS
mmetsp:Transcript_102337/g.180313  ORF Transcript_102337/g.180313 Transcript_102337/m.180313 type:complete len:86 (+) Transcript_102337:1713-1970(+)